jgi:uncharacterized protein YdaU (DUF1376 family)
VAFSLAMSKDPAFLFYSQDFYTGTVFMSDEQVGKYVRLLCLQHQTGHLEEKHMLNICKTYDVDIFSKFVRDNDGKYYNERLEKEIVRRVSYCESRRKNKLTEKTYVKHMETETETETITITDTIINYNGILENFHLYCDRMSKVSKLSDQRKKHISGRFKEFDYDTIIEVLKKAGKSDFLCGINQKAWKADFDWIFNPTNFLKIMEGKYENKKEHLKMPA